MRTFLSRRNALGTFSSFMARGISLVTVEGLKIWLFLCHSEWSLVQKSFSVVSYRPVGLAWQGGILTSDVVFCCCRIF